MLQQRPFHCAVPHIANYCKSVNLYHVASQLIKVLQIHGGQLDSAQCTRLALVP